MGEFLPPVGKHPKNREFGKGSPEWSEAQPVLAGCQWKEAHIRLDSKHENPQDTEPLHCHHLHSRGSGSSSRWYLCRRLKFTSKKNPCNLKLKIKFLFSASY